MWSERILNKYTYTDCAKTKAPKIKLSGLLDRRGFCIFLIMMPDILSQLPLSPALTGTLQLVTLIAIIINGRKFDSGMWMVVLWAYGLRSKTELPFCSTLFPGANILNLACLLFILSPCFVQAKKSFRKIYAQCPWLFISFGLFCIMKLISVGMTVPGNLPIELSAFGRSFIQIVVSATAVFFCSRSEDSATKNVLKNMIPIILLSVLFCVVCIFIPQDIGSDEFSVVRNSMGRGAAGIGFLCGSALCMCTCLALFRPVLFGALIPLCAYPVLLSYTKTAQFGFLLAVLVSLVIYRKFGKLFSIGILILFAVNMIIPDYFWQRIEIYMEEQSVNAGGQYSRSEMALQPVYYWWKEGSLLWGVGYEGYMEDMGGNCRFKAHNGFTDVLASSGILGLLFMIIFLLALWQITKRFRSEGARDRNDRYAQAYGILLTAIFIYALIFCANGGFFINSKNGLLLMTLIGGALAVLANNNRTLTEPTP